MAGSKIIEVKNLVKKFPIRQGFFNKEVAAVHAVNNVSFDIAKGETLGLVGESGCGKSTTGRCIIKLLKPTDGSISFQGEDITSIDTKKDKELRKDMQIIFQNPYASLNPRMTIEKTLREPFIIHHSLSAQGLKNHIKELLEMVGLNEGVLSRHPHEFSGGQRQRIGIARALALKPKFIVADEPVSALDISIQAQIINLLKNLKKELGLTYLFISHDLSVIRYVCDRVAVMYLGEIVEIAPVEKLYSSPKHPYTQALLSSAPDISKENKKPERIILKGDLPSPINAPSGCKFHTRCPYMMEICQKVQPECVNTSENHFASCHLLT